jgi:hypothetical protein
MDRLFLDANVLFIASYREQAGAARLWQLAGTQLVTSFYAIGEIWRNVADGAQGIRLAQLLSAIEFADQGPEDEALARSCGLPDKDVPILQAALSARATHLLTVDQQHFGPLFGTAVGGVLIQTPGDYLRARAGA